jgi:hypothetical protein
MRLRLCVFIICIAFLASPLRSFPQQTSITQIGPNTFEAGIPTLSFYQVALWGQQRCPEWCWAASCQMVLNYYGLPVSQEQIVERIYGQLICDPANDQQILQALSGWAPNYSGGTSTVYSEDGLGSISDLVTNLAYYKPLIVAMNNPDGSGHAMVLTGIRYSVDQFNNIIPISVVLRDPWPLNQSRQEWSWDEFNGRIRNVFRVWIVSN